MVEGSNAVPEPGSIEGLTHRFAYRTIALSLLGLSSIALVLALDLFGGSPVTLTGPRFAVMADSALTTGVTRSSQKLLNEAWSLTDRQALQSPSDPRIALRRAQIAFAKTGHYDDQVHFWLSRSFDQAPYEASIELPRAVLALNVWDKLDPEVRQKTIANIRVKELPFWVSGTGSQMLPGKWLMLRSSGPNVRWDVCLF